MNKQKLAIGTVIFLVAFYLTDSRLFSQAFPAEIIPNYQFKTFRPVVNPIKPNFNYKKEVNKKRG